MPAMFESGFFVKTPAWHKLGVNLVEAPDNAKDAMRYSSLDWEVEKVPLYFDVAGTRNEFPLSFGVIRKTDNRVLGSVGPAYVPVQNVDMFSWFDDFVKGGQCTYETAGSLYDGERIWALCKINRDNDEIVPGDEFRKYLLLANSHNGKSALSVMFTGIRVQCANMLAMALSNNDALKHIRIRHSRNVKKRLLDVKDTIDLVNENFKENTEKYRYLASKQFTGEKLVDFVKRIFAPDVAEEDISTRTQNVMKRIIEHVADSPGNKNPKVAGTWWAAYNGLNYYLQHEYGRNDDSRVDSMWFGKNALINNQALSVALEMAA